MDECTIDILGYQWKLRPSTEDEVRAEAAKYYDTTNGRMYYGLCITSRQEIMWSMTHPDPSSVKLHEVIHAVSDQMGIGLTEEQVQALETGLRYVFRKNAKKFKDLFS